MNKNPDIKFMELALRLARKGEGMTSPNPLVGAVLVRNGRIIGKGYHKKAGLNRQQKVRAYKMPTDLSGFLQNRFFPYPNIGPSKN